MLSTSDPVVLLQSKFWPGSISDMTYVFDQYLLLQWDILQKQIPGISERAFLKSLELYSKRKGRVSETNLSSCTPSHIICLYNKQYTSQIADRWRRFSWWICWLKRYKSTKVWLKIMFQTRINKWLVTCVCLRLSCVVFYIFCQSK